MRSAAEWSFVGVPELPGPDREALFVEWQSWPSMERNASFVDTVGAAVGDRGAPIFLLCRSGARSKAAAVALTAAGHEKCYNVTEGFEGPVDAERHRGTLAGWKACGLPWKQV